MKNRPLATYFLLCFLLTWSVAGMSWYAPTLALRLFGPMGIQSPAFLFAVYVPTLLGIALTAFYSGRAGLWALLRRLNPIPGLLWGGITLVLMLMLSILAALGHGLLGGPGLNLQLASAPMTLAFALLLDPGPLGEELGWRGFAFPRMIRRYSPLVGSVLLGIVWAAWHVPAFYIPGMPQMELNLPLFLVACVATMLIMSWLTACARGNLWPAIIAHLLINHAGRITGADFEAFEVASIVFAAILVAAGQFKVTPNDRWSRVAEA
jgi:uncharacterized protein